MRHAVSTDNTTPMDNATDERVTPDDIYLPLHQTFQFDWDGAATRENTKVDEGRYFGPDHPNPQWRDALTVSWHGVFATLGIARPVVWLNPPYTRGMVWPFCKKTVIEAAHGVTTVLLLPADVSTVWFRDYVRGRDYYLYAGRGKFLGAPLTADGKLASAKFGSILLVARPPMPEKWLRP